MTWAVFSVLETISGFCFDFPGTLGIDGVWLTATWFLVYNKSDKRAGSATGKASQRDWVKCAVLQI